MLIACMVKKILKLKILVSIPEDDTFYYLPDNSKHELELPLTALPFDTGKDFLVTDYDQEMVLNYQKN